MVINLVRRSIENRIREDQISCPKPKRTGTWIRIEGQLTRNSGRDRVTKISSLGRTEVSRKLRREKYVTRVLSKRETHNPSLWVSVSLFRVLGLRPTLFDPSPNNLCEHRDTTPLSLFTSPETLLFTFFLYRVMDLFSFFFINKIPLKSSK